MVLIEFEQPRTVAEYAAVLDRQAEAAVVLRGRAGVFARLAETSLPLNAETRELIENGVVLLAAAAELLTELPVVFRAELAEAGGGRHVTDRREAAVSDVNAQDSAVPDPLRVAGRFRLAAGERFAGSGSLKDREGALVLAVAVDTPQGRQVHVGVPIFDEERRRWAGGHGPARVAEVDEDGEEHDVETGADHTVILDAVDAARLEGLAEDVIARAAAVDREYRRLGKDADRLEGQRVALESTRFGGEVAAERKMRLDQDLDHHRRYQPQRRAGMAEAVACLDAADRARYDALQARVDAAGLDVWEPGREEQAAAVCGLTVAEFRELKELSRIKYLARSREQRARLDALRHGGDSGTVPPLLEEQQALISGLTVAELRELKRLEHSPSPRYRPVEQARLDELHASPRGARAATPDETRRIRGQYRQSQHTHHADKTDYAHTLDDLAALEASARPLPEADAARLAQVTADLDAVEQRLDAVGGRVSASAEIGGRHGDGLVVEAYQREEAGGVDYRVDHRPAGAGADWTPGQDYDPYTTTPAGLRKFAALARRLAGVDDPH